MKKLFSISCLVLFCTLGYAQNKPHTIKFKLNNKIVPFKSSFKFSGIIDRRLVKSNVGFVQKGINGTVIDVQLEDGIEKGLGVQVAKIIQWDQDAEEVFFVIHEFSVHELRGSMSYKGICRLEIEFVKQVDDIYYSLGTFSSVSEEKGLYVTGKHDDRLIECLSNCILEFERSNWTNKPLNEIVDLEVPSPSYNYRKAPPKGIYASFSKMGKGEPMEEFEIKFSRIRPKTESKTVIPKYELDIVKKKNRKKRILFISNGSDIFMLASIYSEFKYFLKSKHHGRYIYFEDRLANGNATRAFGATGLVLSIRTKGIILDTSTGMVFFLTERELFAMLDEHKDIAQTYKDSKRKRVDMEMAVVELNKRYLD